MGVLGKTRRMHVHEHKNVYFCGLVEQSRLMHVEDRQGVQGGDNKC